MPSSSDSTPDPAGETPEFAEIDPEALVQVGFVFRPHGIEGELKIDPEKTDDPSRFEELSVVYLGSGRRQVTRHPIASVRYQETKRGTTVILGLDEIDSRTEAEEVTKFNVFAAEDDLELEEGELFIHELIGMEVVTEAEDDVLGTVANVMEYPAQQVFVIRQPDGEQVMIPAVEDFILDIDEEAEQVLVRPIEGLLE